jgi:hypothetical protein
VTTAVRTPRRLVPSDDPNAYARWRTRQIAYGRWQPLVDAEPARTHVKKVMAATGIGWRRYADIVGIPRTTMTYLLYGSHGHKARRITPGNERKLLSLQADSALGVTIPAIGTHRRIQALAVEGWPQIHLAPVIGTHRAYVSQMLQNDRITATLAEAVNDAYERLRGVDPVSAGVSPHGVRLAQRMAAKNKWLDRTYWDDVERIDDPHFDPITFAEPPRYMRLGEDALWLKEQGYTREQAADRLGVSVDYMEQSIKRYRAALATEEAAA